MKAHFSIQAPFLMALVLLPMSTTSGQGHSYTVWFKINDDVGGHDSLVFGNNANATYCVDSGLGENQGPPPPQGFSAVFMSIPGRANCFSSFGLIKKDLRPIPFIVTVDTFDIQFQNNDSTSESPFISATLRWPDAEYLRTQRCTSMFLSDRVGGAVIPTPIDMFTQDSIVLTGQYDLLGHNPTAPIVKLRIIKYANFEIFAAQDQNPPFPKSFTLKQNFPNPFNPSTSISFSVPRQLRVRLKVFNLVGQLVETVVDEDKQPGSYSVTWDASNRPSGLYFYRLTSGSLVETKTAVLLK